MIKDKIDSILIISRADTFLKIVDFSGQSEINTAYKISNNIQAFLIHYYNSLVENGISSEEATKTIQELMKKNDMGPIFSGDLVLVDIINLGFYSDDSQINDFLASRTEIPDITLFEPKEPTPQPEPEILYGG